jgi:hypothetical protein
VRTPTELELMLFHDGEIVEDGAVDLETLPEEDRLAVLFRSRADEIAHWLERAERGGAGEPALGVAESLAVLGDLVRADAARQAPFVSVAGAVMGAVERREVTESPALSSVSSLAAPVAPVSSPPPPPVSASWAARPTPVRARLRPWITGSGLLAAAAACALFVLHGPDAPIGEEPPVPAMLVASAPSLPAYDGSGVAVDTVDFGAKMGTIFLQPGEASLRDSVTTVVWIRDEEPRP